MASAWIGVGSVALFTHGFQNGRGQLQFFKCHVVWAQVRCAWDIGHSSALVWWAAGQSSGADANRKRASVADRKSPRWQPQQSAGVAPDCRCTLELSHKEIMQGLSGWHFYGFITYTCSMAQYVFFHEPRHQDRAPEAADLEGRFHQLLPRRQDRRARPERLRVSTLLKIMAGIDKEIEGEAIAMPGIKIGYLPQEPQLDPSRPCARRSRKASAVRRKPRQPGGGLRRLRRGGRRL